MLRTHVLFFYSSNAACSNVMEYNVPLQELGSLHQYKIHRSLGMSFLFGMLSIVCIKVNAE